MCEFNVMAEGKKVFEDAVYASDDGRRVVVRDILGQSMHFPSHRIVEVSVEREELVIARR